MTDTEELVRLRLTVAKVRYICSALREQEAEYADSADVEVKSAVRTCRTIANAIEDALIDADYVTAGETEEMG